MNHTFISAQNLISCIENSMEEKEVVVPSTDFYSRIGDTTTATITFMCPYKLIEAIERGIK